MLSGTEFLIAGLFVIALALMSTIDAAFMAMPPPSLARFRAISDVQLTAWSEKPWEARAHYEASYLWARYLTERGGGSSRGTGAPAGSTSKSFLIRSAKPRG